MNGDDITQRNDSMPWYPAEMNLFRRAQCLLGYHKREKRQTFRFGSETRKEPMQLRDQCGRCHTLLGLK